MSNATLVPARPAPTPAGIMPQASPAMQGVRLLSGRRSGAGAANPDLGDDELEATLLREFLSCRSVATLALSLAARIDDGTSPEEFIAAAAGAALV